MGGWGQGWYSKGCWQQDRCWLASLLLLTVIADLPFWLGWRQPVAGDPVYFWHGLMSHYAARLQLGEWPWWNSRWGFGFPGVAESQVGAFYPLHLLLYSWLPTTAADRLNLVIHRLLLVGLGFWSWRWLGLRPAGAALAILVLAFGGFVTVHRSHHWAVLSLPWTLPILAVTHQIFRPARSPVLAPKPIGQGQRSNRWLLLLAWLVCLQLLVGHFQIAFITLVAASIYGPLSSSLRLLWCPAWGVAQNLGRCWLEWVGGIALGFGLAGLQLGPTACLAAELRQRSGVSADAVYLSLNSLPWHALPNLFWPGLYQLDPRWRPVAWTPFASAPEETLRYVGILPLFLAVLALVVGWRRPWVQRWLVVGVVGVLLALSPTLPGFASLIQLPGFSFFRCFARWSLLEQLALAALAGWSLDRLFVLWPLPNRNGQTNHRTAPSPALSRRRIWERSWSWFLASYFAISLLLLAGWGLIDWSVRYPAAELPIKPTGLVNWFQWTATPAALAAAPANTAPIFHQVQRGLVQPQRLDDYTARAWFYWDLPAAPSRLLDLWPTVLWRELGFTAGLLLGKTLWLWWLRRQRRRTLGILLAALVDLAVFQWLFLPLVLPTAPLAQLKPASPFRERLQALPTGTRVVGPGANFLQCAGLAPLPGYRSLDLTFPKGLRAFLNYLEAAPIDPKQPVAIPPEFRHVGVQYLVRDHVLIPAAQPRPTTSGDLEVWQDDQLQWWLEGHLKYRQLLRERGFQELLILRPLTPEQPPAVLLPLPTPVPLPQLDDLVYQTPNQDETAASWTKWLRQPEVGQIRSWQLTGEQQTWKVSCSAPAVLVLGVTALSGWQVQITALGPENPLKSPEVWRLPAVVNQFWLAIPLPERGDYRLSWRYIPPGRSAGLGLSIGSLMIWGILGIRCCGWRSDKRLTE